MEEKEEEEEEAIRSENSKCRLFKQGKEKKGKVIESSRQLSRTGARE